MEEYESIGQHNVFSNARLYYVYIMITQAQNGWNTGKNASVADKKTIKLCRQYAALLSLNDDVGLRGEVDKSATRDGEKWRKVNYRDGMMCFLIHDSVMCAL